ncbi:hypothetical protein OJ998_36320 [Solirubrobacter taibaiensis]|nr:hypothetical protein [Solirubrobacter taibaiensis]
MRRTLVSILAAVGALVAAAPASAGTITQPNACFWSIHSRWEQQNIDWAGTATPNPLAPGSGATLTGTSAHVRLPDWVTTYGDFFNAGVNELPTKVWIALTGENTVQGVQVVALDTVARTTVTDNPDGTRSMTPIEVTVPLPDTAWTAGVVGAAAFRQAGPGTLPPVPVGRDGANVTPKGSVFIATATPGGVPIQLDCQPGQPVNDRLAVAPVGAGNFESVPVQAGAVAIPAPKAVPALSLRTTALKAKGRQIKVALSCTAADCHGALTLKAGSKSVAAKKSYSMKSGARQTVTLTLTKSAQKALKQKQSRKVTLRITATGGKTITKQFTLR